MTKLFWIDMEMTGLDVSKEVIIEVAAVITDLQLNALDTYSTVVRQEQKYLDAMDDWNKTHHRESGLTEAVPKGKDPAVVERELIALLDKHFKDERAVIAGNSISQDRLFINKYFKSFAARLHYRMLDVTAWKIMMNARFGIIHQKKNAHRAVDDIQESIDEMRLYLSKVDPAKAN
ncbi:MAG TPA: oligoribonuclease [Bdellovibrionales bacterium]|nr:oligoribonuclease [Bdellovibrionales bacterium]